ncbi:MAG: Ni/Fe hydrogenase subunit alpha [Chromatiales bacterium]|nr:Ni/Fe hydrogenase subunit alpha [Chromatiales bacterium]
MSATDGTRTIRVRELARVEGEAALKISVRGGRVQEAQLNIFEPPRFFEALLRGRQFAEAPDITARICGICPVAYQMSAVQAIEQALAVEIPPPIRALRRLLYCGEWIESHGLHVYLLHAPDFLGYQGAIEMARDHRAAVQRGLKLKQTGNRVLTTLGGREIHPVNVRVGGFYKLPSNSALRELVQPLREAREAALETVRWVAGFEFPDCERDYEFVALQADGEYPIDQGRIVSSSGLDLPADRFDEHFVEEQVRHSTALHGRRRDGQSYLVGPLARYSLNHDRLWPLARKAAEDAGLGPVCRNPYRSIIVRGIELVQACDEALAIIEQWERPAQPAVPVAARAATGYGCTEAPRGLLYHRYRLARDGSIEDALIVPPTSQNQPTIERDLEIFANDWLDLADEPLRWRCEQAVRNYDPCISCATHFLRLEVDRG